ncbi:MAG TPA: hypothetical protein VHX43_00610 [Xanthobacteraceae bacterium]|jgi:hypothetical protein|nr:hypothetical protein [Xanthobacteraceae bacterium]
MKKILIAAALAMLTASPVFAATAHRHQTQSPQQLLQTSPRLYMYAPTAPLAQPLTMDGSRAQAMQECNALAGKWSNSSWQTTQLATYGECMTAHGQQP